jgi:hypothetical protein
MKLLLIKTSGYLFLKIYSKITCLFMMFKILVHCTILSRIKCLKAYLIIHYVFMFVINQLLTYRWCLLSNAIYHARLKQNLLSFLYYVLTMYTLTTEFYLSQKRNSQSWCLKLSVFMKLEKICVLRQKHSWSLVTAKCLKYKLSVKYLRKSNIWLAIYYSFFFLGGILQMTKHMLIWDHFNKNCFLCKYLS